MAARILIAEDEPAVRALVTRALMQDGHDVVATADGSEALEAFTRAKKPFKFELTAADIGIDAPIPPQRLAQLFKPMAIRQGNTLGHVCKIA